MDRKREKLLNVEIARYDEMHLGIWANKSDSSFILFRLHRDGSFDYKFVPCPQYDTVMIKGNFYMKGVSEGGSTDYYPRLIAIDEKRDTLFNFFIAYITPYDSKTDKIDKLVLNPNSIYDTVSYVFYRIKA